MTKALLILLLLITTATTVDARDRRKRERHYARNIAVLVLLLNDEYERCLATYVIHYGNNVEELCTRDLMNFDGLPIEVREQWYREYR